MRKPIYLDHNATTPLAAEVIEAMERSLRRDWGNPSSAHALGREAKAAIETARARVAALIGAPPGSIVFTSGGTEADNLALYGILDRERGGAPAALITSPFEHPAVAEPAADLERRGHAWRRLPCDAAGRVAVEAVHDALPGAGLLSVMHAHNETGVLQPIEALVSEAHGAGVPVHTDASQTVGKRPVDVGELGVELLTIAAHKLYGPKGVGALYVRPGVTIGPALRGAGHESGRRPGTENVPAIVGFGVACTLAQEELERRDRRAAEGRDRLERALSERFPDLVVHGADAERLGNTSFFAIPGADADRWVPGLEDVALSTGSACHADGSVASSALAAMGVSPGLARCTVRVSLGRSTTLDEIDRAAVAIADAARRARAATPT